METKTQKEQIDTIPEEFVHISDVYKWGQSARHFGGRVTQRTIQWYSSSGLIPAPKRIGKEAYYNRYEVFHFLRSIEILNRRFGILLSEIRKIFIKIHHIGDVTIGEDDQYQSIVTSGIHALAKLLDDFLEYEGIEESKCDESFNGPMLNPEQIQRIELLEKEILKRLRGGKEKVEKLISDGLIDLEEELFPDGKVDDGEKPF